MSTESGHARDRDGHARDRSGHARDGVVRAVVLVRHHGAGRGAPEVHLVPLPPRRDGGRPGAVGGLCGAFLSLDGIETVRPGEGVWCTMCFLVHVTGGPTVPVQQRCPNPIRTDSVAGRLAVGVAYQRLGWPVTLRRNQVTLSLDLDVDAVALVIPTALATEVIEILIRRRCPPPVLAHPALPDHRVIIAGERFTVPLVWPTGVHRVTGTLLLPPSITAYGPVCWACPPRPDALRLCREIEVLAALRTALRHSPTVSDLPDPPTPD